jgi:PAS domain S-box-containing protein
MVGSNIKVLAIDDNQDNLIILEALIKEAFPDIVTLTAQNGKMGLELAAIEDPDVILLDIVMPEMDGFEVCERLKVDPKLGDIPVIFITSLEGDKNIRIKALEAGGEAFLAKPVDQSELIAQIRAMVKIKNINIEKRTENEKLAALVDEKNRELNINYKTTLNLLEDIIRENEARKKSEINLRKERDRAQNYLDTVETLIIALDTDGMITKINRKGCQILGYSEDELVGQHWFLKCLPQPVGMEVVYPTFLKLISGNSKNREYYENPVITKSGNIRQIIWHNALLYDDNGQIAGTLSSGDDITERKLAEEALIKSEEKYRAIFENVQDVFYQTDLEGIVLEISPSIKHFSEFNRNEIIGKPVYELYYDPADRGILLDAIMKKGELRDYELRLKTNTNKIKYVSINATLINGSDGKPDHIDGAIRDITERILAKKELQENEEKYRKLVELSPDAVLIHINGIIQFVNAAAVKIFDAKTKYDLLGLKIIDLVHPEYQKIVKKRIQKIVENDEKVPLIEEKLITLKGRIFDADVSATPIVLNGENGIQVVARDISERKMAEQKLAISEKRYKTVSKLSSDFSYSCINTKTGYEVDWITDAFFTITGYSEDELKKNKCWLFAAYSDDRTYAIQKLNDLKPGQFEEIEFRIITKKGDIHHVINRLECISDSESMDGKRIYGAVQDITERTNAELALKESEERYRNIFNSAAVGIYRTTKDGRILLANPRLVEILGFSSFEDLQSRDIKNEGYDNPETRGRFIEEIEKNGFINNYEVAWKKKDHSDVYVNEYSRAVYDDSGKLLYYEGTVEDITEQRITREALKKSEEKYRLLFENASQTILVAQDNLIRFANPKAAELLGATLEEINSTPFADFIHPDDKDTVINNYQNRLKGEQINNNYQFRVLRKDGTFRWVEIAAVLFEWEGRVASLNFLSDITERKQAENRIRLTSKILNFLNNPLPLDETIKYTINLIKVETGFDAVGMRLKNGNDFPYYFQSGFSDDFLETENTLLQRTKSGIICMDQKGKLCLECTCGLVISGKFNKSDPHFTKEGSFWANNSPELLSIKPEDELRCNPRNRCIHDGYNSVALIPIRSRSEIVGLLQLNDRKKECFTVDMIQFFESIGEILGVALMRKQAEEELEQSHKLLFKLSEQVPGVIYQYRLYPDGRSCFPYSSSGMNDIYEYSPDEVREDATPVFGRLHPDDSKTVSEMIFESARNLNHFYCEFRVILPRQGLRWRYCDAIPERIDDGGTLWHGIIYDITERKNAEKALQDKYDELENFNSLMVGREIKMIELKKEINNLLRKEGKEAKYEIYE